MSQTSGSTTSNILVKAPGIFKEENVMSYKIHHKRQKEAKDQSLVDVIIAILSWTFKDTHWTYKVCGQG